MSKVTSICGMPRGAGGISTRLKVPRDMLSETMARSPWRTFIVTAVWKSAAVEKIWLLFVGIVVFLSMILVKTRPRVSMPRDNGVTSRSSRSFTSPVSTPPCMAAPVATHSIGSTPLSGCRPIISSTNFCTRGILVIPPIKIILSMFLGVSFASSRAFMSVFSVL